MHNFDPELIHSVYGLSSPTQKEIDERAKKVKRCVTAMGDKYLLATPIGRKK